MKCKFGIVSIMLAGLALTATAQTKEELRHVLILITLIMALDMPSRH